MKLKNITMRTQVVIIGGGPSGLLLSQLLMRNNIDTIILERCSRSHVLSRIRAGVIEHGSIELLKDAGVGDRIEKEGIKHTGFDISSENRSFRVNLLSASGKSVSVYGQTEITLDLYKAQDNIGGKIFHNVENISVDDVSVSKPTLMFHVSGQSYSIITDFIAGCDGSMGISKNFIPSEKLSHYKVQYPFGWLGVLSRTKPVHDELIYANHSRGFALASMRNNSLSRYYIQASTRDNISDWPDEKFWAELKKRLPSKKSQELEIGPSIEKSLTPIRSEVVEPMKFGNLFLVGDAAHIVPPTGAKGLNLAFSDVFYLSQALIKYYKGGPEAELEQYSKRSLARVWQTVRFSTWMTKLLHTSIHDNSFEKKIQLSELSNLAKSEVAQKSLAENYVGLPY